jgi:hypothetical protein
VSTDRHGNRVSGATREAVAHFDAALTRTPGALASTHLEGAARYFAGWHFEKKKQDERRLLTGDLRKRLLTHALRAMDTDKMERARRVFAE